MQQSLPESQHRTAQWWVKNALELVGFTLAVYVALNIPLLFTILAVLAVLLILIGNTD